MGILRHPAPISCYDSALSYSQNKNEQAQDSKTAK